MYRSIILQLKKFKDRKKSSFIEFLIMKIDNNEDSNNAGTTKTKVTIT